MRTHNRHFKRVIKICLTMLFGILWLYTPPAYSAETAQKKDVIFHMVREIYTSELGIQNPKGLNFSPQTDNFYIMSGNPLESEFQTTTELRLLSMDEESKGLVSIPAVNLNPANSSFNKKFGGLLFLDRSGQNLVVIPAGSEENLHPSMLRRHSIKSWGLKKPLGMTMDQTGEQIFILDLSEPRIVKIGLKEGQGKDIFEDAYITEVDLHQLGLHNPKGLAYDPTTGNLHIFDQGNQTLYEITQFGQIVASRNLSKLKLINVGNLLFAPSFDQTDNPEQMNLYLADSGESKSEQGRIIELSLYELDLITVSTFQSRLYNTIDTSRFTPPSPDPCGIDYIPSSNTLLICDSEVNEMTIWKNVNLFEVTLSGGLVRTSNTTAFAKEPTGIAYNTTNGHMFFSNDDARRITEVAPGADGLYGTPDDTRTVFQTSYFGSNDPEGVAYDPNANTLFIVDGVNEEVYLVKPGINGFFDNVAPYGDDQVTSFDTTILGVHDPEAIGFNPITGHLYITDTRSSTTVAEVTIEGSLVQKIDISVASAHKPAGLGFGPSSSDPATLAMYVTDRGVDNNSDPNENDGKVYELSLPTSNLAPTVSITNPEDQAVYTEGEAITFTGFASDAEDGDLSASITWTSSQVGVIGTGSTLTRTNLSVGTHTISAVVTDSKGTTGSTSVTITVNPLAANLAPTVSITNPEDQAVYIEGEAIAFTGIASDAEDGDLSASITWTSSRDGGLGTGSTLIRTNLTVGTHTISAVVTDSSGATGSASVTITVNPVAVNLAPTVSIMHPEDQAVYIEGEAITFTGIASDVEDGNLSASITWTSSRDGGLGTGSTLIRTNLTVGTHTISAVVTDSSGATGSASVTITVNPVAVNLAPTVSIMHPEDQAVYTEGEPIAFTGIASDAEDGDLSTSITWASSQDGVLGIGSTLTRTNLSVGTHTISAAVTDSKGTAGSASITVVVNPIPQILTFAPTDDAMVSSNNALTNYGTKTTLELRKSKDELRSYLKFDVTGLKGTIRSAKLRLYSTINSGAGGSVYVVSNNYKGTKIPWVEGGLNWKKAPSITGEPLNTLSAVTVNTWVDFNVTAAILGDGEYSFALVSNSSQLAAYNSKESDFKPELLIEML